ncbi:MAG: MarR family transcriptional regulator [Deltaproteobacteria bacterium]|nr:MarR family transcriptional regulator [Deltaproteobacteria bacterium]
MGTHYDGAERETRSLDTYIKLMRCVATLGGGLHRSLAGRGLTPSQFGVLESLMHLGPMCQKAVGQKLLLSGGNVTTVVKNLEKRGLISRTPRKEDRRFMTVALTDEGRTLIEEIFPAHAADIADLMEHLEPTEQEALGALCRKLGTGIAQQD